MDYIEVNGDNRTCGRYLGKKIAKGIMKRLGLLGISDSLVKKHKKTLSLIDNECRKKYPLFIEELAAMSDGSGVPYMHLLLINCLEIINSHGCSSIAVNKGNVLSLYHNEDADPFEDKRYFPIARYTQGNKWFCSFIYPGELPGASFGWNCHGLVITVNNLRGKLNNITGKTPRIFTARSLIEASSIDSAIKLIRRSRGASGFHYFIMDNKRIVSVEQRDNDISQVEVNGIYAHTNHCIHDRFMAKSDVPKNSGIRIERINEMIKEKESPLQILFDRKNLPDPIYNKKGDYNMTLATFTAISKERKAYVYTAGSEKKRIIFDLD